MLATFAGFRLGGVPGALTATVALFLPAVLLMLIISFFYEKLRNVEGVSDFLAGVGPAVVGLIAASLLFLIPSSLHWNRIFGLLLCLATMASVARWKIHPSLVLFGAALLGWLFPGGFL